MTLRKEGITPSALAMRLYLHGRGQLQLGSVVDPRVDRVWLRPICGGRWSIVHVCSPISLPLQQLLVQECADRVGP